MADVDIREIICESSNSELRKIVNDGLALGLGSVEIPFGENVKMAKATSSFLRSCDEYLVEDIIATPFSEGCEVKYSYHLRISRREN